MLYKQLPWIVGGIIIAISVAVSAFQLYPVYQDYTGAQTINNAPSAEKPVSSRPEREPQRNVANYSMFGKYNENPEPKVEEIKNLPKTRLKLILTGVTASEDADEARALIEGPDRNTESYRIGEALPGNASLHSVHADRVILSRSGKLETLFFPNATQQLITSANRDTAVAVVQSDTQRANGSTRSTRITDEQRQSIRDRLNKLRTRLNTQ